MQFIPARLKKARADMAARIWEPVDTVAWRILATPPGAEHRTWAEGTRPERFTPLPKLPFSWGPSYAQRWFRLELENLPNDLRPLYLSWNETAEGTLYVDGQPYAQSPLLGLAGGESLIPAWLKPAADGKGFILRLHEVSGQRGTTTLRLADGWTAARTTITEGNATSLPASHSVAFQPYQIVSLRIYPE